MKLNVKDVEFSIDEVSISMETENHIIYYQNKKSKPFDLGTAAIDHKKSKRTFMYYLFRGDLIPNKYKEQMDAIEVKFNELL